MLSVGSWKAIFRPCKEAVGRRGVTGMASLLELRMELSSLHVGRAPVLRSSGDGDRRLRPGVLFPPSDNDRVFIMGEGGSVGPVVRPAARPVRNWPASFVSSRTAKSSQSMVGVVEDKASQAMRAWPMFRGRLALYHRRNAAIGEVGVPAISEI